VRFASIAGFDLVGALRLTPTSDGMGHPMLGRSPMRKATIAALDDCALEVLDVEVVRLRPDLVLSSVEPLLEAGAELGARYLLCTMEDPEPTRAAQTWAELCRLAAPFGLTCMVEFMVFSAVRTLREAVALLDRAVAIEGDPPGGGVLVDTLHLFRSGGVPEDLARLDPARLPYVQLADAWSAALPESPAAAAREAKADRLAPGDGTLPLVDVLRNIPSHAALSFEVPNAAGRADPERWIRYLGAAARRWRNQEVH
jgi:sugar phosphate isomerase/epimerase